jgi:hypothetical protein
MKDLIARRAPALELPRSRFGKPGDKFYVPWRLEDRKPLIRILSQLPNGAMNTRKQLDLGMRDLAKQRVGNSEN